MLREEDQAKPQVEGRVSCSCVLSLRLRSERAQRRNLVSWPSFGPLKDRDQRQAARSGS